MGATVRFLIISAAIIIPWAVIRLADLEMAIIALLKRIHLSDMSIVALLLIPPVGLFLIRWLFEPRNKQSKRFSGNKDVLIKFRG